MVSIDHGAPNTCQVTELCPNCGGKRLVQLRGEWRCIWCGQERADL